MKIRACIFDLDGVLCDTSHFHFVAWAETAKQLGVTFTEEDNHQLKGVSRVGSLQYILDKGKLQLTEEEFQHHLHSKNEFYLHLIREINPSDVFEGVLDLLKELHSNGLGIALGSSSKNARMVIDSLGISDFFEVIVDGNDVINTKPDPEVFLRGANGLGVDPSEIVVFEDAPKGAEAGKRGGFHVVGIGGSELEEHADVVLPNMQNLSISKLERLLDDSNS